jgi:hypothetical protein
MLFRIWTLSSVVAWTSSSWPLRFAAAASGDAAS